MTVGNQSQQRSRSPRARRLYGLTATANYLTSHHGATAASLVHGYTLAFTVSAILLGVGAVAALVMVRANRRDVPDEQTVMAAT